VIVGLTVPLLGVVTGLALKEALVLEGSPPTLRVTELDTPPIAPRVSVYVPLDLRLTVRDDGDAEMVKSAAGAETTTVRVVECVRFGVVVVPVTVIGYDPAGVVVPRPIFRLLLGDARRHGRSAQGAGNCVRSAGPAGGQGDGVGESIQPGHRDRAVGGSACALRELQRRGGFSDAEVGRLGAVAQLEGADRGGPANAARDRIIFVGVPESTIVAGVDAHRRVIAPSRGASLGAAAGLEDALGFHRAKEVARDAGGISDRREERAAGGAVAERNIACRIHRGAAHPAIGGIGREGALLEQAEGASRRLAQFVPAHTDA